MTTDEVRAYYGSSYAFMKRTGMSDATFRNWMNAGRIPESAQYKLERLTNGELKCEVSDFEKPQDVAYKELKRKIVKLMFEFTNRYAVEGSALYPDCVHILVKVLGDCLTQAKEQT